MKNRFTIIFLLVLFSCDNKEKTKKHTSLIPNKVETKGYIIPKDSIAEPTVISIDEKKLKKVPAGNPKVVPTNLNVHPVGEPKVVLAGHPLMITPGADTFSLPKVVPVIDSPFVAIQPQPIAAQPFRMKDDANCNIQYLDVDQGMNSSFVLSILEDKNGNLWFGNWGGFVSKYDGKSFTHYTLKEGISNNSVTSIIEDKGGNLWFGTWGGGITKYDGKTFTHYTEKEGLGNNTVWSILEDKSGNLWFGTAGGITKYDGRFFTHYTKKEGLSSNKVWSILEDKFGNLWFGTFGGGVSKFDGRSFFHYTEKEGLSNNIVLSILEDRSGNLWFGTNGGGVTKYDGKSFTHYTEKEGLSNNTVRSILKDKDENLWFGTNGGGVSKYDGKLFTHYTEKEGLSHSTVCSILEDRGGNLWFGTEGGGVSKFNRQSFVHYSEKDGLKNTPVKSILEDKSGNLWFGTQGEGVIKYDGSSFIHYTEKEGLSHNTITSTLEDGNGNIWFGTWGGGVTKYDGSSFTHYTEKEGLCNNVVLSILEDKSGNLWFGTYAGGASKLTTKNNKTTFTTFTKKEGLSSNHISAIFEDKHNNLWFGTGGGGVSKLNRSKFEKKNELPFSHYTEKEGLGHDHVHSILVDEKRNLWLGTGGGISKLVHNKNDGNEIQSFVYITENDGLSNNDIRSIIEAKNVPAGAGVWVGTEKGINFLNNKNETITIFHKEDGLKAENFYTNAVVLDSKNRIWWGSGKALTMLDLNKFRLSDKAPEIQIENIYLQEKFVDYKNIKEDSSEFSRYLQRIKFSDVARFHNYPLNLELPYDINHMTFHFSAIDWCAPHKIKYQYKLEGMDSKWSELTQENKADYRNIPYGKYTFKVKAIGSAHKWSKIFEYEFVIHPPWWNTNWFRAIYISIFLLSLYLLYRWRTSALRERQVQLEKIVKERTAEVMAEKEIIEEQKNIIEEKHKEITDSINYAERIQRSFLATSELLNENLNDYFVFFQPKDVVSGDFYWASKLISNGNFVYVCADSTGHGVPGAIMSILNISSLEKAIETKVGPAEILNETRKIIIERLKKDGTSEGGKDGMDASLIILNKEKTKLAYAAAYNPIWIIRNKEIIELKPDKMPVGKHDKDCISFAQHEFDLQKGDMIYSLTDGFADQFGGPKGKKYKYSQLKDYLISISEFSMEEQHQKLRTEFENWRENLEQVDDVTIIGVRI